MKLRVNKKGGYKNNEQNVKYLEIDERKKSTKQIPSVENKTSFDSSLKCNCI